MATPRVDMKGFYKQQKKKSGGVSKPSAKAKSAAAKRTTTPKHSASVGSDVVQSPALVSHGSFDIRGLTFLSISLLQSLGALVAFLLGGFRLCGGKPMLLGS
ncbi:hypothetical protein Dimus_027521 [Dionaea muscipula]